jgi:hypothetical protein
MLNRPHFHVVFTLPSQLRSLAKNYPHEIYNALFAASSRTLLALGQTRLGAQLGITSVLHTWTRELTYHPHVHSIVSAGGLSKDGTRFIPCKENYLFPLVQMQTLWRGKVMARLRHLFRQKAFDGFFADKAAFDDLMATLKKIDWVVYVKPAFKNTNHVIFYLGRYTHRVGIANSRLVSVTNQAVTFRTKGTKTATASPVEFLRRFVMHVLPTGFVKIRHSGLYAAAHKKLRLAIAHALEPNRNPHHDRVDDDLSFEDWLQKLTGKNIRFCPRCGLLLYRVELRPPWNSS